MTPSPANTIMELPCACNNLRRAARIVTRIYDHELQNVGLESSQHGLLLALHKAGEVNQKWLSQLLAMDSTTLTRTLGRLRTQGWVKSRAGRDQRQRWFRLTAAGKRKLAQAQPHWERAQQALQLALGGPAWKDLHHTLVRLTRAAAAA